MLIQLYQHKEQELFELPYSLNLLDLTFFPQITCLGTGEMKARRNKHLLHVFILSFFVVDLPLYFPRDQPTLTFQSVYHFTNSGELYSQAQKNYPYSPRWDGNEMAKRAK